ncbi:hypothetical protein [Streptomyces sp. NPDC047525]
MQDRTIVVDTSEVRSTDFRITQEQAEMLNANGRFTAEQFLARWSFRR